LEVQLKEARADYHREREQIETRLRVAEIERAELGAAEVTLRETVRLLQEERAKEMVEREMEIKEVRVRANKEVEEAKERASGAEERIKEVMRRIVQMESEQDK
jgi:hypothetical protein